MVMGRSKRGCGVSLGLRKCDSHQGCVKGIKHACQLIERCDGHDHGGDIRRGGEGVTVVRNYDSPQ